MQGADTTVNAVSTDSRKCRGALFVPLKGERFDGHDFIEKAVAGGAACIASARDLPDLKIPVLRCEDTLRLLGLAGKIVRAGCPAKVASLTGSCGKTTVKELTAAILSRCGKTAATQGNFNNDVGVPLTLLNLERDTQYAVIEQGASHPHDISRTCEFVQADTALINNAGSAHIEGFGSKEGVYLGKSEILDDVLGRGGAGAVPSDSPWTERWRSDFASYFAKGKLFTFGTHPGDLAQVTDIKTSEGGVGFELRAQGKAFAAHLPLLGAHNALNAAAACALALLTGASFESLKPGLESARAVNGRLYLTRYKNFTLVDDAYNASFNAVCAALGVLSGLEGRRVMILGDMGELGEESEELHTLAGAQARGKADALWCLGPLTKSSCKAFGDGAEHFESHEALIEKCQELIVSGQRCSFVVKGSHAMRMDTVSDALKRLGEEEK